MKHHLLTSLCVLACSGMQVVNAQQISVAGKVTDQNGAPIQGVTITVKGTKIGTATNASGLFTINADQNATLSISAIGYAAQEIKVNGRKTIHISLTQEGEALDEVMVVAYGTAKKSTFTGSASTVSAKDIKDVPTTSFEDALRGKVAGMQVTSTSGQAGSSPAIRIRGIGSMNASNEPLYVIDGVPVVSGQTSQMSGYTYNTNNVMSTLNPNDIESVTVLKDAAASSLYGSRAANGVVIITTKKGKSGAAKINFRSSLGLSPSWATDNYEKASPQDQINLLYSVLYDSRIAAGRTPEQANEQTLMRLNSRNWTPGGSYGTPTTSYGFGIHGYEFSTEGTSMFENVTIKGKTDGVENRDGLFYDWDKDLFRTGKYNSNDISISGASETTNYFSSLGYTSDKGRMVKNDYERFNGRVNLNQKIGKLLEFGVNVSLAKTDLSGINDTRNTSTNYLLQSRNLFWPFYWPTDYKTGQTWTTRYNSYAQNINYYNNEWENGSATRRITASPSLLLKILPELNVKTVFSFDETNTKDDLYYSPNHYTGASDKGIAHAMVTNYQKLVSSTTANYNKSFGLHNLGLLVGWEAEKNNTDFVRATGRDLPNSALHTVSTAGKLESQAYSWGNSLLSALSRAEYNFDEKYFASASLRRDGASKLGPDVRWGNFWSVGAAWNIDKEEFIKKIPAINLLRLRGSYGTNGTLPSDNNAWRGLITYSNKYMEQAGGGLANSPNPDLTWETNYNTTVALEYGLFNNKVFGTIEYYNRDSKDLIQDVPQSTVTGFSSTVKNIGQINNRGVEILLGSDIIKTNDWNWTLSINAATAKSKVVALNDKEDIIWTDPTGGDGRTRFIYREGESTLAFYGLEWAGVDPTNGKNVWYVNDPKNNPNGDFDFNGKAATYDYTKAQRTIIGDGVAELFGGINSNLGYKGLSLGLNFNYRIGGKLYDSANRDVADDGYYWERIHSANFAEETWTAENPTGTLPIVSGRDLEDVNQISSRHLNNASFIRLKNISLSYNIPSNYLKAIKVSNARIFFNGTNLLTFSKFKLADPEVNQYSTRGWETPLAKTYTFGIDFSF
ncbi:SusC/RagA family TonB-linked outer membrane protein [Sphingobacterium rhinopitheci]|uniref:SusC/RagA family TonB-linked outer membrane protein n=1 Tax=Sphingobacterium rhinopitheci TaxID=2781960 RepID=UPI001F51F53A|nr:TonB-dependent receptor [Sphingobacterium rhinopitheci]MCI0921137.1 TonB-dependent receptor [Sphingobacterium rhinopitheci]